MGLLEDAIREHLDLKRQHGADLSEVAAEEREALGPVQRTVEPAVVEDEDASEDASPAHDEPVEDEPGRTDLRDPAEAEDEEEDEDELDEPAPPPPPPEHSVPFDFEDEPFAPEPPPAEKQEAADEDVLEETPEFLQETPEHDRLWFEQKPPRDFDFDR
jgi:hypothetical protein